MTLWRSLLLALAAAILAGPARAEPPVWVVSDADSTMLLFGSVHVLPPGLDWRPDRLEAELATADDVWFELPVDAATEQETARLAQVKGLLRPDESLFRLLPPSDSARLLTEARRLGLSPDVLDRLQPWLAEVALAGAAYRAAGADVAHGVERQLSAATPPTARRMALEAPGEQLDLLAQAPREAQIASLRETLERLHTDPDLFHGLVAAWMAGDLAAIERDALAPLRAAAPELYSRLVDARNARWAERLDARLKGRGRSVVVVGVGHLVGPDSLPDRLRALGYSVAGP